MNQYVFVWLTIALLDITQAANNPQLKQCYDNLKKYNIKAIPVTYSQLVEVGKVYGNQYCEMTRDKPKTYTCDHLTILPKNNSCATGLMDLSLAQNFTFFMAQALLEIYETSIPGVYELYEQMTHSNGRLMAVLEAKPGTLVIYLCSVDPWKYNDFRINTAEQFPNEANVKAVLAPYLTTPCHLFQTTQSNCPLVTVSLSRPTAQIVVDVIENVYLFVLGFLSIFG